jgi:hypothetical protein
MKRKIIILVLAFAVVVLAGWFFLSRFNFSGNANVPAATVQTSGTTPITPGVTNFPGAPQGDSFVLGTPNGSVTLKNFYKLPVVIDGEFLILENSNDYQITFDTVNSQFFIYASSSPLGAARAKGESAFLAMLGLSESDACKLNVAEGYPAGMPLAGLRATLSFCAPRAFVQ